MLDSVKILFEDENFLAIDKPSGLVIHSDGRTEENSLVDWLKEHFKIERILEQQKNIGNKHTLDSGRYEDRWGILNRLDRETSGIVFIAKKQDFFDEIQKKWKDQVVKKYIAILHGEINIQKLINEQKILKTENETFFKIIEPLSRHKKDPRIWVLKSDVGSRQTVREAETIFEIVKTVEVEGQKFTIVNFWPITGRTHQLRLHAKFLDNPILGDKKYSFGGINEVNDLDLKNRLMLHAIFMEIPCIGKNKIETEIPFDFQKFMIYYNN
jgi:23S rRNA pseudouridine1911/1915/1917 synthase